MTGMMALPGRCGEPVNRSVRQQAATLECGSFGRGAEAAADDDDAFFYSLFREGASISL